LSFVLEKWSGIICVSTEICVSTQISVKSHVVGSHTEDMNVRHLDAML